MYQYFKLKERGSSIRIEAMAGITTFLSMVYIIFVNPNVLSAAGMEAKAVFVATILSASGASLLMGLWANYPIALASGMGINAFFSFVVVGAMGYSWQTGMAAIFISGLIFFIVSFIGLRAWIINAIPAALKHAVAAGIGFFITFLGLKNAGIIVANPATFVSMGDLGSSGAIVSVCGFLLTAILFLLHSPSAIFLGLLFSAILALVLGVTSLPTQLIAPIPSLEPILLGLFQGFNFNMLFSGEFWVIVFSFFFVDFFDTSGTLIAISQRVGLVGKDGLLKHGKKALLVDSIGTMGGALLGTSSVTCYIESLTGVEAGGRTGLTAVVAALCFLLTLFFAPLLSVINSNVTAPALIMVGCLMVSSLGHIQWTNDLPLTISSFLTVIFMVLTFSIAEGIAVGFLIYPIMMLASKRAKEVHPVMYGLMILFLLRFISFSIK